MEPSAVPPDTLVVVHGDRKAQRALARLVGATGCPVRVASDPAQARAAVDERSVVVVDHAIAQRAPELCREPARAWIAVPGDGAAPADAATVSALVAAGWRHVVAHPMPLLAEELLATIQKILRGDLFGLEKYMAWGAEVRSYKLDNTADRAIAVDALARDVVAVGLPDRIGSLVSVIADELLANAIYAAPVDATGNHTRVSDQRDRARALDDREQVTVRWATDGRYLAIEVRDRFGSLDPAVACRRLASAGSGHTSENGMGLPLAYACSNHFVIGVAPQQMTEVISLLDVRYKPTELGRMASFHMFVGAPGGAPL